MLVDKIPESYYFVATSDTRKLGTRGLTSTVNEREKQIAIQQDPVGWFFFTQDNLNGILKRLTESFIGVTLATVFPHMTRVFHVFQPIGTLDDITPDQLAVAVDKLNQQVEVAVTQELLDIDAGSAKYARYVLEGEVALEKHAEWTKHTRREEAPRNVASLVASQSAMPFLPQTDKSAVTPLAAADKYAGFPMAELAKQAKTRWQ
jgi:hypothetical protein